MIRAGSVAAALAALLLAPPASGAASPAVAGPVAGAGPQEASAVSPRPSSTDRPPDTVPAAGEGLPMPPAESLPAGPGPEGAELDQLTARVAAQLRCPVCRNQSVLESSATLSQEMQREIRRRLAGGDSPEEVKEYFVSRYGEWILLQPPAEGINLLVYVLPALALLAGLFLAWRRIRSWAAAGEGGAGAAATGPSGGDGRGPGPARPEPGGDGLSREEEERVDALVREG